MSIDESFDTIIIGGGQAGLAAGYFLSQRNVHYTILDENSRIGATWRKRWDSLRLFTPSQNNSLPGMKFPKPDFYFPTKDEAADYLETYARHFSMPILHEVRVDSLSSNNAGFQISGAETQYHARTVIVATGGFHTPYIPAVAEGLHPDFFQMHSVEYRSPKDVPVQNLVVVGAGNSGAEIALDLSKNGKNIWLAGRDVGRITANKARKLLGGKPYWWFLRHVMTNQTPLGRRMKANVLTHGNPLVRIKREDIAFAGVKFTNRLVGSSSGYPQVEGGQVLPVEGVVWATGFRPDYHWINFPIFDESGRPRHERGVVPEVPGLYFLGLHFQTGLTSSLLGGVGADARYITNRIFYK